MKHKILLLFIYVLLLVLVSCSPETRLQKSINRYGQKESAKYFVEHYPEYFIYKTDTVRDTVIVKEIKADTLLVFKTDTITFTKDKIVIRVIRIGKDSLNLNYKIPADTIYREKPCPEQTVPDAVKLNSGKQTILDGVNWIKVFTFIGIGAFLLILFWLWRKSEKEKD